MAHKARMESMKSVGTHVGDKTREFGQTITQLVKEVNDKIDKALSGSAQVALEASSGYQSSIENLEQGLTEFTKSADILKADLSQEHQAKVRTMGEEMQRGMEAHPDLQEISSLASIDQTAVRGRPPPDSFQREGWGARFPGEAYMQGHQMPFARSRSPLDDEIGSIDGEDNPYIGPYGQLD